MQYTILIAAAFILATIAVATLSPFDNLPQRPPQEASTTPPEPPAADERSDEDSGDDESNDDESYDDADYEDEAPTDDRTIWPPGEEPPE